MLQTDFRLLGTQRAMTVKELRESCLNSLEFTLRTVTKIWAELLPYIEGWLNKTVASWRGYFSQN